MHKRAKNHKLINDVSIFKNALTLLAPFKCKLTLVCLSLIIGIGITTLIPLVNRAIIDKGLIALDFPMLIRLLGLSILLFFIGRGLDFYGFKQFVRMNKIINFKLMFAAQNHLLKLPISYFKEKNEAQIIGDIRTDVDKISMIADRFVLISIMQGCTVVGSAIGLLFINPILLLIVLVFIPVKVLFARFFAKRHEKLMNNLIQNISAFGALLGDALKNVEIIKLWDIKRYKLNCFAKSQRSVIINHIGIEYNDKVSENIDIITSFALNITIYIIGFWGIFNDWLTIGGLLAFITYAMQIIGPVTLLTKVQRYFADIKPSLKRHIEFLNLQEENTIKNNILKPIDDVTIPNKIVFSNVSFAYNDGVYRLSDINLEFQRGKKIAIVGENGSGKSTLVALLLRFYEPTSGEIYFDNTQIGNYNLYAYRKMFSVVSQNIRLFNETIRENVDPTNSKNDDEITNVLKRLGFEKIITELHDGLDTYVGNDGGNLSGGQGQKITAVRALLKGASILILDEATSKYDSKSEEIFNELIFASSDFDYVIVITHNAKIHDKVDRVFHLHEGRITNV